MRRNFRKNIRGAIWIWAVCFLAIVVYSMAYYSLGWPLHMIWDSIEGEYTFSSPTDTTLTLIKTVVAWHPILFILGMILWAFVNSQRQEVMTYRR